MQIIELSLRILLSYIALLALTRIMGRKEISQMTFFNFVSAITIGTIGGALITDANFSIRNGLYALAGWSLLTIVVGFIDIKSKKSRTILEGEPLVVMKNGKIMENALRRARLDADALNVMLREKNVFSFSDVDYAIFETDGKLSVMKKANKQPATKGDLNLQAFQTDKFDIPTGVISDGKINAENLSKLNLDQNWLDNQLKQAGMASASEVFYAEVKKDGTLYIDPYSDQVH